jgi:hypothetical protein
MGGKGGGGGSQTVQQKADPWAGQQPYLNNLFSRAENLYQQGQLAPGYYPGQTVADQDPWTSQALRMQADRAMNGSEVTRAAQDQLVQTLKGGDTNPYLEKMVQQAAGQALSSVNGNFAQAGRYGSGAHEAAAGDTAAGIAAQMYGQAYDQDRDRQIKAMSLAPTLAGMDYQDISALSEAGTARENYRQELINAAVDRYNYEAGRPLSALQNYGALVQGNYGMSGSSTATQNAGRSNPLGNILGGAISGGAAGSMGLLGGSIGGPLGALGGGLLGGLLSLF